jgi:O-antigen/teichoic acid export membrane protein
MPPTRKAPPRIARSLVWSVGGSLLPLPAAVLVIRPLLVSLGAERFGVLALAWAMMGYFNLFDVGVGRATTNQVAGARAAGRDDRVGEIVWSSMLTHLGLGLAGGLVLALAAPFIADHMLTLEPSLAIEARQALWLLALSVPLIVASTACRAILEGLGRFDLVAAGNVATGLLVYLLPFAALAVSATLPAVIGAVLAARALGLGVLCTCALRECPAARTWVTPSAAIVRQMFAQGGWLTASALINPAISTIDRFILASVVSAAVVGFYSIPYDIVARLWLLTGALLSVLFPAFSGLTAASAARLRALLARSATALIAGLAPLLAIVIAAAPAAFTWWLGPEFAAIGAPIAQLLAVGMLFSAVAHLCTTLLQAVRRAGLVAALDVGQLVFYALAAWWAAGRYGPVGVAAVWMLRAIVQACLALAACHASKIVAPLMPSIAFWGRRLGASLTLCAIGWMGASLSARWIGAVLLVGSLGVFGAYAWHTLFDGDTRALVRGFLRPARDAVEGAGL